MLADAKEGEAEPIGERRLLDDVAEDLCLVQGPTVGARRDVAEGVEAELDGGECRGRVHHPQCTRPPHRTSVDAASSSAFMRSSARSIRPISRDTRAVSFTRRASASPGNGCPSYSE